MASSQFPFLGHLLAEEERPDSDVDILVEFRGPATFDRYMDTKFYLEELLGRKVDLVTPKAIKPRMKPYIMQDLVHVACDELLYLADIQESCERS